jgi:NAD(P)H-flavin reductase
MSETRGGRAAARAVLRARRMVAPDIAALDFDWETGAPRAGQFFMIKPSRSPVFLPRPIGVFGCTAQTVSFLVAALGTGTEAITAMSCGDTALLTGPLGNAWRDFLPATTAVTENGLLPAAEPKIALVSGGVGIAPLAAFARELVGELAAAGKFAAASPARPFDFYAGFRAEPYALDAVPVPVRAASEEGGPDVTHGLVTGLIDTARYAAVYACGPLPMLKALAEKCRRSRTPCFVSMENRMACGVGACLGCTVRTTGGNKRCCKDGPVFNAAALIL